jgi:ABC-type transporter Mla MlaB component
MAKKKAPKEQSDISLSESIPEVDACEVEGCAQEDNHKVSQGDALSYDMQQDMTLDEVQNFLDGIVNQLRKHDIICVNLEQAEKISTATVQAIISLNRYACDNQKKIKWQNPSTGFSDAFNNLGFYSEMMKLEFA